MPETTLEELMQEFKQEYIKLGSKWTIEEFVFDNARMEYGVKFKEGTFYEQDFIPQFQNMLQQMNALQNDTFED